MDHQIRAYFYTAQDSRRAMNALEAINATVGPPEPVQPPQNGRSWALEVTPTLGSLSPMYQDPVLLNQVVGIIKKFNGVTDINKSS